MFHGKCYTVISIPICICANYSKISTMSNAKLAQLDGKILNLNPSFTFLSSINFHQTSKNFKVAHSKH